MRVNGWSLLVEPGKAHVSGRISLSVGGAIPCRLASPEQDRNCGAAKCLLRGAIARLQMPMCGGRVLSVIWKEAAGPAFASTVNGEVKRRTVSIRRCFAVRLLP